MEYELFANGTGDSEGSRLTCGRGAADEALFEENDLSDFSAVPKIEKKSLVVAAGLDTAGFAAPRRLMTAS